MYKTLRLMLALFILLGLAPAPGRAAPTTSDLETYTYQLTQSTSSFQLWTTTPGTRVFKDSPVPAAAGSEVKVYAAKDEFEPFQMVVKPAASGNVTISIDAFGSGITAQLYQVRYVNITSPSDSLGRSGPYPDPLWPIDNGATVALAARENTAFWFNLYIPPGAAYGDYTSHVHIAGLSIPVRLHVFNFAVPAQLHLDSEMNFSFETVLSKYSVPGYDAEYWFYVDSIKQFFIDHRLTPSGPLWPGGMTYGSSFAEPFIDYGCTTHTFTDNYGIWGFEAQAQRYIDGSGLLAGKFGAQFNGGVGFPTFRAAAMADNDPSIDQRPNPFCGITRSASDWLQNPTSAYNTAWFSYIMALQNYLSSQGYLGKTYHYFANEPQDQADYNAVAWYSRYSHAAAPNLKLIVSEEPRPEIYNQPGAHIDIWLPVLEVYNPAVSHSRWSSNGEESWIYFLHSTRPPYFNPITLDHPGIDSLLTGWFAWKYRLRGIAYYSLDDWSKNPWTNPLTDGHNGDTFMLYPPSVTNSDIPYGSNGHRLVPSIRFELMRDSLEDYEYLYLLAGGQPQVGSANPADPQVDKIISGLTAYTRNPEFLYNLRRLIGLKNSGEISAIPDIQPPPENSRANGAPGNYYLNFQDPAGEPLANPLVVNGKTYMKIGSSDYSASAGYGWYYPPDVHWLTAWLGSGPNVLQRSVLYSDYGRRATFDFDLPNGQYNVTVSVGWQGGSYSHQKIVIEGQPFINDEATTPAAPYLVRTRKVTVNDSKLSLEIGIAGEYTMLNYLDIEAANPPVTDLHLVKASLSAGTFNAKLNWTPPASAITTTLRYASFPIISANWISATLVAAGLPGSQGSFDADVPYISGTLYFAVNVQNSQGDWAGASNNAFWPNQDIWLPVMRKR